MTASSRLNDTRLDKLAEVAVKVGLGGVEGQQLVMTAPIEAVPLVRRITEHAYKAGATLVTTIYGDDEATLARYGHAHDASFDTAPAWLYGGMAEAYKAGSARLAIAGGNPMLLAGQDPEKVGRANKANSAAYRPAMDPIVNFDINWTIVSFANPAWAKAMFPDLSEEKAVDALWDAIFAASRIDAADPVAEWERHNGELHRRRDWMNGKAFQAIRFRGPGTDLTVGLAEDHRWCGGADSSKNGRICNANIPTEEVFTTPHKDRVEGMVRSTKPLSYMGTLIEDIAVRFEGGVIVEATASKGADVLHRVLETDEGARRIGEVALVPHSSPISKSGLLFYNTLYDENASSHIALGQAYSKCFVNGGDGLSPEDLAARGANKSLIHIDWMIGSADIDVDGIHADGSTEPVMRAGEWA